MNCFLSLLFLSRVSKYAALHSRISNQSLLMLIRWKAYFLLFFDTPLLTFTRQGRCRPNRNSCPSPRQNNLRFIIVLFPFDMAEGSIMGLLQATCIMPNSSRFLIQQPCDPKLRRQAAANRGNIKKKEKGGNGVFGPLCLHCRCRRLHPQMTPALPQDGGEDPGTRRGSERTHVTPSELCVSRLSL